MSSSPSASQPHEPRRRASLGVIFFTIFLDLLGFSMVLPLLRYYAKDFEASPLQVTLLFACYSLAQFVFAPIWGRLSDRIGRRPVLLAAIAASIFAYLAFAAASSYLALLIARIASGAAAANYSIAQAWIADVTRPEERARGMGLVGAAFGLGFVFGPVLGGLAGQFGYVWVPLTAAALAATNLILAFLLIPESLRRTTANEPASRTRWFRPTRLFQSLRHRGLALLMALYFLVIVAFSLMEATLALFLDTRFGFDFLQTNLLFILLGVVIAAVQGGLIGRLVKRFGERRLVVGGIVLMGAGLATLPAAPTVALLAGTTVLLAIGNGIFNPSALGLISRQAAADSQGGTLGLARSMGALARGVGPIWGGWAFGHLGIGWPFWSAAVIMAVALVIARFGIKTPSVATAPTMPSADSPSQQST